MTPDEARREFLSILAGSRETNHARAGVIAEKEGIPIEAVPAWILLGLEAGRPPEERDPDYIRDALEHLAGLNVEVPDWWAAATSQP